MLSLAHKIVRTSSSSIKFSQFRKFSTPNIAAVQGEIPLNEIFSTVFEEKHAKSVLHSNSAKLIEIEDAVKEKYLPEGFAGDIDEEFKFAGKNFLLVRQTTKLVCNVLDEFKRLKSNNNEVPSLANENSAFVAVPGLNSKPEWSCSTHSVKYYGKEIVKSPNGESLVKECVDFLKTRNVGNFPGKIMLSGKRGVGKSAVLTQAVLHARQSGWLCMFIPRGWEQTQHGDFVLPVSTVDSNGAPITLYDNNLMTLEVLRNFWAAHKEQLRALPIQDTTVFSKFDEFLQDFEVEWKRVRSVAGREKFDFMRTRATIEGQGHDQEQDILDAEILGKFDHHKFKPKTLEDLIIMACAFHDLAGPLFLALIAELRNVESVPVLFAVDQYNMWGEMDTAYAFKNVPLLAKDLCVPGALHCLVKKKAETDSWTMKNGLCLVASSFKHTAMAKAHFKEKKSIPLDIEVPHYNQMEFVAMAAYYAACGCMNTSTPINHLLALRTYCGSHPRELRLSLVSYLLPLQFAANNDEYAALLSSGGLGISAEDYTEGELNDVGGDDDDDEDEDDDDELEEVVKEEKPKRKPGAKKNKKKGSK